MALAAAAAELPPAAQVLKETGVDAGLTAVVGTTDGALEAGLTRGQGQWVSFQDTQVDPWRNRGCSFCLFDASGRSVERAVRRP